MNRKISRSAMLLLTCAVLVAMHSIGAAQGRGRGAGQPSGNPGIGGPPAGVGVDRGISTSSDRSNGRADAGRGIASDNSNGRSDAGLDRARLQRENAIRANEELNGHPLMAARLNTTANDLRAGYHAALLTNPSLTFGQYVAATRLAANLGARFPGVTRAAILDGLANGRSIGQTLQNLGLNKQQASEAKKQADREIKEAKRH